MTFKVSVETVLLFFEKNQFWKKKKKKKKKKKNAHYLRFLIFQKV